MATEQRLISAQPIANGIALYVAENAYLNDTALDVLTMVAKWLDDAPTIEARPVVHGRWEPRKDIPGFVRCSVCHDCNIYDDWADGKKWNYCPNCGADMRGADNG